MRGQRLAGIFLQFWAVFCAKSATNNLRVLITEIAEQELGHESGYCATFVLTVRGGSPCVQTCGSRAAPVSHTPSLTHRLAVKARREGSSESSRRPPCARPHDPGGARRERDHNF